MSISCGCNLIKESRSCQNICHTICPPTMLFKTLRPAKRGTDGTPQKRKPDCLPIAPKFDFKRFFGRIPPKLTGFALNVPRINITKTKHNTFYANQFFYFCFRQNGPILHQSIKMSGKIRKRHFPILNT